MSEEIFSIIPVRDLATLYVFLILVSKIFPHIMLFSSANKWANRSKYRPKIIPVRIFHGRMYKNALNVLNFNIQSEAFAV